MKAIVKRVQSGRHKDEFRFVLKAKNGEIIADSRESYTQKHNVISLLKKHFSAFEIIDETKQTKNEQKKKGIQNEQ